MILRNHSTCHRTLTSKTKKNAKHEVQNFICNIEGKITEFQLVLKDTFPFTRNVSTGVSLIGGKGGWVGWGGLIWWYWFIEFLDHV